jgi:hypothetical protein
MKKNRSAGIKLVVITFILLSKWGSGTAQTFCNCPAPYTPDTNLPPIPTMFVCSDKENAARKKFESDLYDTLNHHRSPGSKEHLNFQFSSVAFTDFLTKECQQSTIYIDTVAIYFGIFYAGNNLSTVETSVLTPIFVTYSKRAIVSCYVYTAAGAFTIIGQDIAKAGIINFISDHDKMDPLIKELDKTQKYNNYNPSTCGPNYFFPETDATDHLSNTRCVLYKRTDFVEPFLKEIDYQTNTVHVPITTIQLNFAEYGKSENTPFRLFTIFTFIKNNGQEYNIEEDLNFCKRPRELYQRVHHLGMKGGLDNGQLCPANCP